MGRNEVRENNRPTERRHKTQSLPLFPTNPSPIVILPNLSRILHKLGTMNAEKRKRSDETSGCRSRSKSKSKTSMEHLRFLAKHYGEPLGVEFTNICTPCAGLCYGGGILIKENYEKSCRVCTRPFSVVRYKVGRHDGDDDYRETEICYRCSRTDIICQTCGQPPLPPHAGFLRHLPITYTAAQIDSVRQVIASGGCGVQYLPGNTSSHPTIIMEMPKNFFDLL